MPTPPPHSGSLSEGLDRPDGSGIPSAYGMRAADATVPASHMLRRRLPLQSDQRSPSAGGADVRVRRAFPSPTRPDSEIRGRQSHRGSGITDASPLCRSPGLQPPRHRVDHRPPSSGPTIR